MPISNQDIRRAVGRELGIIWPGTASGITGLVTIADTTDDSPFNPADVAERFSGAGIYIRPNTAAEPLNWRPNITYDPANQEVDFASITALTGTPTYEIHTEPLLHPILVWPFLVNDALRLIRRISWQYILLNSRGYYTLNGFGDIDGPEQVRRLYMLNINKLLNADFEDWPTSQALPTNWTLEAGTPSRADVSLVSANMNYSNAIELDSSEGVFQDVRAGIAGERLKLVVPCDPDGAGVITVTLEARDSAEAVQYSASGTSSGTDVQQIVVDLEIAPNIDHIRVRIVASAVNDQRIWAPMLFTESHGSMRRIQPLTVLRADEGANDLTPEMRMYIPPVSGVGRLALLLPYPTFGTAPTNTNDVATTEAPDDLIIASTAMRVLNWLTQNPGISDKSEYATALTIWKDRFKKRAAEHMRKLAKTPQVWEAGEQPGFRRSIRVGSGRFG